MHCCVTVGSTESISLTLGSISLKSEVDGSSSCPAKCTAALAVPRCGSTCLSTFRTTFRGWSLRIVRTGFRRSMRWCVRDGLCAKGRTAQ